MDGIISLGYSSGYPAAAAGGLPENIAQPITSGSQAGAPGVDSVSSSWNGTQGGGSQGATAFGVARAKLPPTQQPVFWIIALMVIAVIMLAHVANLDVK